jgi:peptidyl-prolyl cis-trans isomerase A (cyclophilin A)
MQMRNKSKRLLFPVFLIFLVSCGKNYPHVLILTEIGTIEIKVYTDKAPKTAQNFLTYIKEDRYRGAVFYRTVTLINQPEDDVKIQVIQGGLFDDNHPAMLPPIPHETTEETGILHRRGVISMARNEPGSASSEFFICVEKQPELDYGGKRNPDGQGFAAFGKVVSGMNIVERIHRSPARGQWLEPPVKILETILKP